MRTPILLLLIILLPILIVPFNLSLPPSSLSSLLSSSPSSPSTSLYAFCTNCGAELPSTPVNFCASCGSSVGSTVNQSPSSPLPPPSAPAPSSPPPAFSSSRSSSTTLVEFVVEEFLTLRQSEVSANTYRTEEGFWMQGGGMIETIGSTPVNQITQATFEVHLKSLRERETSARTQALHRSAYLACLKYLTYVGVIESVPVVREVKQKKSDQVRFEGWSEGWSEATAKALYRLFTNQQPPNRRFASRSTLRFAHRFAAPHRAPHGYRGESAS